LNIAGYGSASQLKSAQLEGMNFHYVYILQSEVNPDRFYVGLTDDLQERLRKHNAGEVVHTMKFKPWVVKTAIAFRDRDRAAQFERYLKSGSGRAFARKHL
jgi:predicted GIY-YIG superfamily endonuclease